MKRDWILGASHLKQKLLGISQSKSSNLNAADNVTSPDHNPVLNFSRDYITWRQDRWLQHLEPLQGKKNARFLEVGTFEGRTLVWLFENIFFRSCSRATVVDPFVDGTKETFLKNLKLKDLTKQVTLHEQPSEVALRKFDLHSFDFIYLDGCHCTRHVVSDAVLCWELLKPGGIIIFDDYLLEDGEQDYRPHRAIDIFLEAYQFELKVLSSDYDLIVEKSGYLHSQDQP